MNTNTVHSPAAYAASALASPSGAGSHSARPERPRPGRVTRAQLIADAVVANYIHAISSRGAH